MKSQLVHKYNDIISLENLCLAWQEFVVGKKSKLDVLEFERNLTDNIVKLHEALVNRTYRYGDCESFYINDPKRRHIHKASVRDHSVLRNTTKHRMMRRVKEHPTPETYRSYLGLLSHWNAWKIRGQMAGEYWMWRE